MQYATAYSRIERISRSNLGMLFSNFFATSCHRRSRRHIEKMAPKNVFDWFMNTLRAFVHRCRHRGRDDGAEVTEVAVPTYIYIVSLNRVSSAAELRVDRPPF
uniref:SFRICE_006064 n=1 Tax=Spodoptera frugiperda TaxID=7108 RepID=A0A2H1V3I8_SPOFR